VGGEGSRPRKLAPLTHDPSPPRGEGRKTDTTLSGCLVSAVAFALDGNTLVTGDCSKQLKVWDLRKREVQHVFKDPQDRVRSVCISPDGQYVGGGGRDTREIDEYPVARVWRVSDEEVPHVLQGFEHTITTLAFTPDGKTLATGSHDGSVRLWDTVTWTERSRLQQALRSHGGVVITVSPDGRLLAAGDEWGVVHVWDLQIENKLFEANGHTDEVWALAFRTLATGSKDTTVRLWQVATGKEMLILRDHDAKVSAVAFSPDGKILASGDHNGVLKLWHSDPRR